MREIGGVAIAGRICEVGLLPNGYRVYLDDVAISGMPPEATPERVRLRIGGPSAADHVGQRIEVTARLGPISAPVAPGAFDFQRDIFFERIGAVGYAFGAPRELSAQGTSGWLQTLPCRLSALRLNIANRIRAVLQGDTGAIAVALITGDQGAISKPVRGSGLRPALLSSPAPHRMVAGTVIRYGGPGLFRRMRSTLRSRKGRPELCGDVLSQQRA